MSLDSVSRHREKYEMAKEPSVSLVSGKVCKNILLCVPDDSFLDLLQSHAVYSVFSAVTALYLTLVISQELLHIFVFDRSKEK